MRQHISEQPHHPVKINLQELWRFPGLAPQLTTALSTEKKHHITWVPNVQPSLLNKLHSWICNAILPRMLQATTGSNLMDRSLHHSQPSVRAFMSVAEASGAACKTSAARTRQHAAFVRTLLYEGLMPRLCETFSRLTACAVPDHQSGR